MKNVTFATKLPEDLTASLDDLCRRLGLKKSALVETALREKIEDLLDAYDLRETIEEETRFHSWESVKGDLLEEAPPRRPSTRSK